MFIQKIPYYKIIHGISMQKPFKTVGLIGRQRKEDISDTLLSLTKLLQDLQLGIVVEDETAKHFPSNKLPTYNRHEFGKHCDLIIVVGGDGSLLNAARAAIHHHTPVLGINRGRLGFLTDINPSELTEGVSAVLAGEYIEENRFLLTAQVEYNGEKIAQDMALNDVVLLPGNVSHMIEFEIVINGQFVCSQKADGLIVATPTGSTAYALSGGGPILHPNLDAVVLVPMFPHTLSARPIVIPGNSEIKLIVAKSNETCPRLSCDGQERIPLQPGTIVVITKKNEQLRLIHPIDYNYFETLRTKLHWSKKL